MRSIILLLSLLAASSVAYQFDNATGPDYPVVIPLPQNISYGSQVVGFSGLLIRGSIPYGNDKQRFVMQAVE